MNAMVQVYTGSLADARAIASALVQLGVDAIGMTSDALGNTAVFVEDRQLEEARAATSNVPTSMPTPAPFSPSWTSGRDSGRAKTACSTV